MSHTTCHCPSCDASSPLSRSDVSTGVRFTKHAYKAHQLHINCQVTDSLLSLSEATDVTGDTTENLDEGAAQIFTTALFDEGPNLNQLPSKLWTSRNDFQASRASVTPPSSMHPSSAIQSLTDAVHCLTISPSPSLTKQFQGLHLSETPPSPSRLIEQIKKLNISEIPALVASCSTDDMSGQGVHQSRCTISNEVTNKKDCSQFTQSALHIMDSVEAHLQQCSGKLAAVLTIAVSQEVRTIVSRSREALGRKSRVGLQG
jgi:hypothetical protein